MLLKGVLIICNCATARNMVLQPSPTWPSFLELGPSDAANLCIHVQDLWDSSQDHFGLCDLYHSCTPYMGHKFKKSDRPVFNAIVERVIFDMPHSSRNAFGPCTNSNARAFLQYLIAIHLGGSHKQVCGNSDITCHEVGALLLYPHAKMNIQAVDVHWFASLQVAFCKETSPQGAVRFHLLYQVLEDEEREFHALIGHSG